MNSQDPFYANIEEITLANDNYRKVLYTGYMQLVLMSLLPSEEIGMESHKDHDQFFRIEQGSAKFIIENKEYILEKDEVIIVPAGSRHNVINIGDIKLKLYTIYAPAEHPSGTIQSVKPTEN